MVILMALCITAIGLFNVLLIKRAFKRGQKRERSSDFEQNISIALNGVLILLILFLSEAGFKKEAYVGILRGKDNPYTYEVKQAFTAEGILLKSDTIYIKRRNR